MSQSTVSALAPLPFELVYSDGEPLESEWHVLQNALLRELAVRAMEEQERADFFAGGNMFVYHSVEQARDVAAGRPYLRGPDFFWVDGIKGRHFRNCWVSWEEGGRLPDVIVEVLSRSTAKIDRTVKKDLYARIFRTSEYYMYDPRSRKLEGFWLAGDTYQPIAPGDQGRIWSKRLGLSLGLWHGPVNGKDAAWWVRLFRPDGSLVPTKGERADAAEQKADAAQQRADAAQQKADAAQQRVDVERQRAEAAEAELARLRALLEERGKA
jgi:Uma2 family endonuclease